MISVSTETAVYTLAIEVWCEDGSLYVNASVAIMPMPGKRDAFTIDRRVYDVLSRAAALMYVIAAYTEPKINELMLTLYGETLPVVFHVRYTPFYAPFYSADAYIEAYPRSYTVFRAGSSTVDLPTLRYTLGKVTIAPVYTRSVGAECRRGSSIAIFVWRPATKEFAGRALELTIPALRSIADIQGAGNMGMELEDKVAGVVVNSIYPLMRDYRPNV